MADSTKIRRKGGAGMFSRLRWAGTCALLVVCLIVCSGCAGGSASSGSGSGSGSGSAQDTSEFTAKTLTEVELDDAMGTYTYEGTTFTVTYRDVIELSGTVESAVNDEGTYDIPGADDLLSYARRKVLTQIAEDMGVNPTDEEIASYAEEQLGSSDYATLADTYGLDEDTVKSLLSYYLSMEQLCELVTGVKTPTAPTAPDEPEEDAEETPTEYYATYIIDLAGDEWNSETGTWADEGGDYATALASYEITNDSATYEAAQQAYYIAYDKYSEEESDISDKWTNYCNNTLSDVSVTINTLASS